MEFKGTGGEWKWSTCHNGGSDSPAQTIGITAWNGDRGTEVYETKVHDQADLPQMKADAQLIITARELLAACMDVCNADNAFKLAEARDKCAKAAKKALNK